LKKFFENKDVPLLIYIARACYLLGKETKDHESFLKSRNYLERVKKKFILFYFRKEKKKEKKFFFLIRHFYSDLLIIQFVLILL